MILLLTVFMCVFQICCGCIFYAHALDLVHSVLVARCCFLCFFLLCSWLLVRVFFISFLFYISHSRLLGEIFPLHVVGVVACFIFFFRVVFLEFVRSIW